MNTQGTKLVIFDMDGVLLDSEPFYRKINTQIFKDMNLSISKEEHDSYVGMSAAGMWGELKEKHGLKESVEWLSNHEKEKQFANFQKNDLNAMPGVRSLIEGIKTNGIKVAVGSSSAQHFIELLTEKIGLKSLFDHLQSGESVPHSKPAPDLFLSIAHHFKVHPTDCWVIEDAHHGVEAATNAGMQSVGYQNPHSGNQDLTKAQLITSDFTLDNDKILKCILSNEL